MIKTVTGKTQIVLPEFYNELLINVYIPSVSRNITFNISKNMLSESLKLYSSGYGSVGSKNYCAEVDISLSLSICKIEDVIYNCGTSEYTHADTTSIISVYYR